MEIQKLFIFFSWSSHVSFLVYSPLIIIIIFMPPVCSWQICGWDLKSFWKTTNKKRCHALLRAGRLTEAHEAYRYMMDMSDEATTASYRDWSIGKSLVTSPATILTRISLSF